MHFVSDRNILKEIAAVIKDQARRGYAVKKILAEDWELEELAILAKRPFNGLKQTDALVFKYKGVTITRDNRGLVEEPHHH